LSRRWYLVAIALALLGLGGAALFLLPQIGSIDSGLIRVIVPGEARLDLLPGTYTVFHEYRSVVHGRLYDVGDAAAGLTFRIANAAGEGVPLSSTPSTQYSIFGHEGRSVSTFVVDHAGQYSLKAGYEQQPGPDTVLAIGQGVLGRFVRLIFGTIAIAFSGCGAAIALTCVTYVKRRKAREAIA
jgi:hypothetical protein